MKPFNYRGARWYSIEATDNKYMRKEGYVILRRPSSYWIMRKQHGQMVGAIEAKPENLPKRVQSIAYQIVNKY